MGAALADTAPTGRANKATINVRATLLISAAFRVRICRSARQDRSPLSQCRHRLSTASSGEAVGF
jgi:hypothetical protein